MVVQGGGSNPIPSLVVEAAGEGERDVLEGPPTEQRGAVRELTGGRVGGADNWREGREGGCHRLKNFGGKRVRESERAWLRVALFLVERRFTWDGMGKKGRPQRERCRLVC